MAVAGAPAGAPVILVRHVSSRLDRVQVVTIAVEALRGQGATITAFEPEAGVASAVCSLGPADETCTILRLQVREHDRGHSLQVIARLGRSAPREGAPDTGQLADLLNSLEWAVSRGEPARLSPGAPAAVRPPIPAPESAPENQLPSVPSLLATCSQAGCRAKSGSYCGDCGRALCAGHRITEPGAAYCPACHEARAYRQLYQSWLDEEQMLNQPRWAIAGVVVLLGSVWAALSLASRSTALTWCYLVVAAAVFFVWGRVVHWGTSRPDSFTVRHRMLLWSPALPGLALCSLVLGGLVSCLRDRACRQGGLDELQWLVRAARQAHQGVRISALACALWMRELPDERVLIGS